MSYANDVTLTPEQRQSIEQSIIDIFNEIEEVKPDEHTLDSSDNVLKLIQKLFEKRGFVSADRHFAYSNLTKILKDCCRVEDDLKTFKELGYRSPKLFMQEMEQGEHLALTYDDILKRKEEVERDFQGFVGSLKSQTKIEDVSEERLHSIKEQLETLAQASESYAFIEETRGFFCKEVLTAYRKHLIEYYEGCFFKIPE